MDSISLLGPPSQLKQPINQEDFDSRFGWVKQRRTKGSVFARNFAEWRPKEKFQLPFLRFLRRYDVKANMLRDIGGSLVLASLFIPQGIFVGWLVNDVVAGLLSIIVSQIVYTVLGSGHHSSLGSFSHLSFFVYCSLQHSKASLAGISFYTSLIQLALVAFPSQYVASLVPSQLLVGASLAIIARLFLHTVPNFFVINVPNETFRKICATGLQLCLKEVNIMILLLSIIALVISILFRWRLSQMISSRIGFNIPYEFITIIILLIPRSFSRFISLRHNQLGSGTWTELLNRSPEPPGFPSALILIDALAIALMANASHIRIAGKIATEKMHKIRRRQELLALGGNSLISSVLSLVPSSSSPGTSVLNIEAAKYSMIANILSIVWILLAWAGDFFQYFLRGVIAALALTSLHGVVHDITTLRKLWSTHRFDVIIAFISFMLVLCFPNVCHGFLLSIIFAQMSVVFRVQRCESDVLIKASDQFFVEEHRYKECECPDTPLRILRLSGPLVFVNCHAVEKVIREQVTVVKGLIGVGLGSRTVSLRSTGPGAVGPKESITQRSSTNIVITHDVDQPQPPPAEPIVRFIVLEMSGVNAVDHDALDVISKLHSELSNEHVRVFYSGVNAAVRDYLHRCGFFLRVPLSAFYPNITEALLAARQISLPFHMSVSMNGYRDVVALSTAASNIDVSISRHSPEAV